MGEIYNTIITETNQLIMQLKSNSAFVLTLVALILGSMTGYTNANVIGFDFGSTFFKITLV